MRLARSRNEAIRARLSRRFEVPASADHLRIEPMSTTETVLLIVLAGLIVLILGNIAFQVAAERKNPPIGVFIGCDGVRLHYIERGNAAAPCVVLFHGNGTMIQDLVLSGLVDRLAHDHRVVCFDRSGFGYSHRNIRASGVPSGSCMERVTGSSRPTNRAACTRRCPAPC
jgi:hypothetical protein